MQLTPGQLGLVLVYFIYGLAFFSLGLALSLETWRSPRLAQGRVLLPLAIFGLLHGIHEWAEIFLMQATWLAGPIPQAAAAGRVIWLALSFTPLLIFSARVLGRRYFLAVAFLGLYGVLVAWVLSKQPDDALVLVDILTRYSLAVPGGLLAGLSLHELGRQASRPGRKDVGPRLTRASLGFVLYGLTQLFVQPANLGPASWLNSGTFLDVFGFPVQVLRAAAAVWIMVYLIQAMQAGERERQLELREAQQARLDALEQVQHDLIEREAMRRDLTRHIVIAQEDERARIARELHDETAQLLTAFSLNLAALWDSLPPEERGREILERLQSLAREMSQGIYRLVHDLRPAQLDDLGLVAALQYLADDQRKRSGLEVSLEIEGSHRRLDHLAETVFFRVAQEALTNTARHAASSRAQIQLVFAPEQVCLRICDQGQGFDPEADLRPPKGWGLAGMRERTESIGGDFQLWSAPGQGTRVEVIVPVIGAGQDTFIRPETPVKESLD